MAETWRVTRAKVATFRAIDAVLSPLQLFRAKSSAPDAIKSILVLEPWLIGDVVIATAALRALREMFPEATLTLLGRQHAAELLEHSGLVDDVVVYELPWTARSRKYDPRRYDRRSLLDLIRRLKARHFDLSVDARMDLRSNILTWAIGAKRRVGFDFGGGSAFLTDLVSVNPDRDHRVDDWLRIVDVLKPYATGSAKKLDLRREAGWVPALAVSEDEKKWAERWLAENGVTLDRPIVVIHAGASNERRRWPIDKYRAAGRALVERCDAQVVFFPEPSSDDENIDLATAVARVSLREMMAIMSQASLVLCNDSGPMHIADALGIPVVAVFLTGNPKWHRPSREFQKWEGEGTGHDFLIPPDEDKVIAAATSLLSKRAKSDQRPMPATAAT